MKNKYLDYESLMALAMKHYANGGDCVVECWDRKTFDEYCRQTCGPMTEQDALDLFQLYKGTRWG